LKERTMKNVAAKLETDVVFQAMGTIVRIEGQTLVIQTERAALVDEKSGRRGELRARRAVSCLVEPQLHDFVLLGGQGRTAYVLAVLERESPDATIAVEGNLDVKTNERFRVVAKEGVDIVSSKDVNMMANEIGIHASRAKLFASEILAIGSEVVGELANVKLRGTFFDKVYERVSERVQRSFRRVEEIDQLKAKQMDYLAEETLCLRSENMVAVAKDLVKVDGEQIHFG
jgi:hypothetical protein